MWELISFIAGMLVLMLLLAILPHVFDLPDQIAKYLSRTSRQADAVMSSSGPDEAAARVFGESLRRAELSPEAAAQVTATFWAADAQNRRALAHLLAGMTADGPIEDEDGLLAVVRSLRAECAAAGDSKQGAAAEIREPPACSR